MSWASPEFNREIPGAALPAKGVQSTPAMSAFAHPDVRDVIFKMFLAHHRKPMAGIKPLQMRLRRQVNRYSRPAVLRCLKPLEQQVFFKRQFARFR